MHSPTSARGYTLIEACATLAIATTLATMAAPNMRSLIDARRLDNAATQLASDIQFARSTALFRNQPVRLSLVPRTDGASCYVIHTGSAGHCDCNGGVPAVCSGNAREIKTVTLADSDHVRVSANVASMLFDPLHGTTSPTGTLRVVGADGREVRHVVNIMGRTRSCSPAPAVSGYRSC